MMPTSVRIFVCTEPVDMRRSFDTLALEVSERLGLDPRSGALFVFAGKGGLRLKVLWFDRNGYCILYKRLHGARFVMPEPNTNGRAMAQIDARALARILRGAEIDRRGRFVLDERSRIDHHSTL